MKGLYPNIKHITAAGTSFRYGIMVVIMLFSCVLEAQVGYHNAPYTRYEADLGTLVNASATTRSFDQWALQSEASGQICANLSNSNASVQWTTTAAGDGLVVRYSVPDGQSGTLDVYANGVFAGTLNLSSYYSWESLWNNGNPNNAGVSNQAPKMRFDEVRMRLPSSIPAGGTLRLLRTAGNIHVDFAELEPVPGVVGWSAGNVTYTGNGSDLQTFIDNNGGATIYLPAGLYNVNRELYFGANNTVLKGAGMWYTQIHFTNGSGNQGGLRANAWGVSYSGLYLTTVRNSRSGSYKAINGPYTAASTITNIWAEHFECGAWIAQFNAGGPAVADGFTMSHCRFRNNYADGVNLSKGTLNATVEYCSFRNNGDDDMAIWSANGQECRNNTFRFCTSENTWRASGCAIYGGYNNKGHNLLIQDNVEVGIKCNNAFGGAPFNGSGMHEFYNIIIKRCGTYYDLFNKPVGAIDLGSYDWGAGTRVQNVKFSCIEIIDSKNDAIYINKATAGSDGFYNLVFENITVNGTGLEYPNNGGTGPARGFPVLFKGWPNGNATYCGMTYSNRGGNAGTNVNTSEQGAMSWNAAGTCPGGCNLATASTSITSSPYTGVCTSPVIITANTTAPAGNTVNYVEFFVNSSSIGQDNSAAYSMAWNTPTVGTHSVYAVAHYSGGSTTTTPTQTLTVADGIYTTASAPAIDGAVDALWGNHAPFPLNIVSIGTVGGAADLSATFQITRDATNLYILIDVTDDDLRNDSPEDYNDDAVEIFIDMGNDKSGSYTGSDFQYSIPHGDPTAIAGITFDEGTKAGGYIMEVRIPWTSLGGAPAVNALMGIDIHVNDDDGGGTRDAKKAWKDATDNAWQNPSVLGTLQIAGCSNSFLPVELISFTGELIDKSALLTWSTASEKGNDKFIVERSDNGSDWNSVGEIAGSGNSNSVIEYSFPDPTPVNGTTYYRLKQVDVDGTHAYSSVISLSSSGQTISVSNPFEEAIHISGHAGQFIDVSISDVLGRPMYQQRIEGSAPAILYPALTSGAYVITVQSGDVIERRNIIRK